MMKRLLLPGFLALCLCICLCVSIPANAQDTTKKAEPEKKEVPAAAAPARTKPIYRHHRLYPVANPATGAATPATAPVVNPAIAAQRAKDSAAKTQIDPGQLNAKSLNGQYQYLLTKTFPYQQPLIAALWKNVTDSLNHERSQIKDLQTKLSVSNKAVDSLKSDVSSKEQTLSQSTSKVDTISLFGINMAKSTYNLVMFGLVIGLGAALTIVILTTAKYKYEAKHRTELYEEIEEEYKNYKAKANEKELKLARELQTERNKLDELLGRG
jgi:hypothetical protein